MIAPLFLAALSSADLESVGLLVPKGREVARAAAETTLSDLAADFAAPRAQERGWRQFLELTGATYRKAETDATSGRTALDRFGLAFDAEYRSGDGHIWDVGLSYDSLSYDIQSPLASLPLGVTSADYWRASTAYHYRGDGAFGWYVGGRAEAGAARGVTAWETISLGGSAGLSWTLAEGFDLLVSYDGYDRPEESFRGVVLPLVDWQISDAWRLGPVAGGYGLELEWDSQTRYFVNAAYDERGVRLNDEVAPADWILRDSERSVRAGMIWEPRDAIELVLQAGLAQRDLVVAYEGQELDRVAYEPDAFVGVKLIFGRGSIF